MLDLDVLLPNTSQHTHRKASMTQPGATDPSSQPQYGQPPYGPPHQPPSGNLPDSGSAGYGQQAQPGYGQQAQPGYGQQAQPGYGQQAQPGYGQQGSYPSAPPAGYGAAATQNRPGMVTAAAVLAFISGGLGLIGGLLAFSVIGSFGVPSSLVIFVIVGLVLSIGLIYGGVQALQGKNFVILLGLAAASIVINLISMLIYFQASSLISFIFPILIIVFLVNPQSKAWITARGGKTFG